MSTLPRSLGLFGLASGTSAATPLVAGSAALILAAKGKAQAMFVKQLLQNTAGMIPTSAADDAPFASTAQQGAGLVNVYHAIHAQTVISKAEMLLNDTMHGSNYQYIIIQNPTWNVVTYTISHVPGITISTVSSTTNLTSMAPIPSVPQTASVSLSSTKLTIWPKLVNIFLITIKPPTGVDPTTFPVYSGFISISSTLGETFSIPYMGVAANMKDMAILDRSNVFFGAPVPVFLSANGTVPPSGASYTLVGSDYPAVLYRRAAGTPSLLADLVGPDTVVPGVIQARSLSKRGLLWSWLRGFFGGTSPPPSTGTFFNVPVIGPIQNRPFLPRHEMVVVSTTHTARPMKLLTTYALNSKRAVVTTLCGFSTT